MDGTIVRLLVGTTSVVVEQGQVVAIFVPKSDHLAVEMFIQGNDLPLVYEGRDVRLQFEGWPAVQFSGWPSVAIGTFGGKVAVVDQSATPEGLFRVIVMPTTTEKWPENRFIRQGTRVNGWILLNEVSLGYELWRQFNGFPASMEHAPAQLGSPDLNMP
jgi:membrane fusion protein, adhesin transport system